MKLISYIIALIMSFLFLDKTKQQTFETSNNNIVSGLMYYYVTPQESEIQAQIYYDYYPESHNTVTGKIYGCSQACVGSKNSITGEVY